MRRGRVYYGKLSRGKAMFLARRMIPYFKALWGIPERREAERLSPAALTPYLGPNSSTVSATRASQLPSSLC